MPPIKLSNAESPSPTEKSAVAKNPEEKKRAPRTKPPVPDMETLRNAEVLPVDLVSLVEPAFSPPSLRWHLFHRRTNGLLEAGAVVTVGSRILIVVKRFRAWALAGGSAAPKGAQARPDRVRPRARARTGGSGRRGT
jgi:hypothetical protein